MTTTFTWCPRVDPTGRVMLRTRDAQFGDGYAQSVGDGPNNKVRSWPLQFTGTDAAIAEIEAFLDARGGYESFNWTPRGDSAGLFRCKGYQLTLHGAGMRTLSCTFDEVFVP